MKQRVLSLLSSTTEIIYALGCGDRLVGRSHECDYPEEVSELPICTIPKFNVDGTSREVDDEVKSLVQSALSIYYINEKLLKELKPDIIFTQSQCEVCAVSVSDVENALKNNIQRQAKPERNQVKQDSKRVDGVNHNGTARLDLRYSLGSNDHRATT